MFPQVPVERVHIVGWEAAIGTTEGFPCVLFPNVSIAAMFWGYNDVTLRALVFNFPLYSNQNWIFPTPTLFLHWWWWLFHRLWWWCRWWWCSCWCWWWHWHRHAPEWTQQLGEVAIPCWTDCLLEQCPPLRYHPMFGCYSSDPWNTFKNIYLDYFDLFDITLKHTVPYLIDNVSLPLNTVVYIISTFLTTVNYSLLVNSFLFTPFPWSMILCTSLSSSVCSSSAPATSSSTTSSPTSLPSKNHDLECFSCSCLNGWNI